MKLLFVRCMSLLLAPSWQAGCQLLRQFSQETGGRSFFPSQLADLANVYGQISDELSSQYTVGYTSKNSKRDGSWRRVVVRLARPNLTARTKLGYFAPTAH